jgi:8-oxo-dGTP diphosphatase
MYETWEECAIREVKEETNLNIYQASFGCVTNDPMVEEGKHYVTIFMTAEVLEEEGITKPSPENMEPHKCDGWSSFSWDDLCRLQKEGKLFSPLNRMVMERPPAILDFMQRPKTSTENKQESD